MSKIETELRAHLAFVNRALDELNLAIRHAVEVAHSPKGVA